MQAPKDGDAWAGFEDLKALQGERKAIEDVRTCQDRGEPAETFVTRSSPDPRGTHAEKYMSPEGIARIAALSKPLGKQAASDGVSKAFMRGFAEGLHPLSMAWVRTAGRVNADVQVYSLGEASVQVSGLEVLQATDPELLGCRKGEALREMFHVKHGQGVRQPDLTPPSSESAAVWTPLPEDTVPLPHVLAWSGGGSHEGAYGRVTLGIEGREVVYVPATSALLARVDADMAALKPEPEPEGFDQWMRSPYTTILMRHITQVQDARNEADGMLSHVLHELAGSASLCWEPKPAGVFDSSEAIRHVEHAIERLRLILRRV